MKKLLICGATGFIGRNLVEHFSKLGEYSVKAVYNKRPPLHDVPNVQWVQADLNNAADVERVVDGADVVLQYAATTSGAGDIVNRPYIHVTDNAVMNSLVLRQCYESNVGQIVFPSCTVMYQPSPWPLSESDFHPEIEMLPNYFGVGNTKVYIEKMCEFFSRLGKTKHTVLRQSNIYGPYDKYDLKKSHFFGATVTKVMKNETGQIEVWGSGEEKRDLLHVDDLVRSVQLSLEKQDSAFEIFNIGLGDEYSINEVVDKLVSASGKELSITHNLDKPTIKTSLYLDCDRAKNILGWSPEISLDEGVQRTISWYRENVL